jgi:hypothetical protein
MTAEEHLTINLVCALIGYIAGIGVALAISELTRP